MNGFTSQFTADDKTIIKDKEKPAPSENYIPTEYVFLITGLGSITAIQAPNVSGFLATTAWATVAAAFIITSFEIADHVAEKATQSRYTRKLARFNPRHHETDLPERPLAPANPEFLKTCTPS